MNWMKTHRRSALICTVTLLLPLYLFLFLMTSLWSNYAGYQSDIDYLMPRIARLDGLLAQEDQLRASHARAVADAGSLVYPGTQDRAAVSAKLQTVVRRILSDAGLSVSNSQVLPERQEAGFDYLGLRLSVTGSVSALDAALRAMTGYRPLLLVTSIDIKPGRVGRSNAKEQTATATLQVLSLRVAQ